MFQPEDVDFDIEPDAEPMSDATVDTDPEPTNHQPSTPPVPSTNRPTPPTMRPPPTNNNTWRFSDPQPMSTRGMNNPFTTPTGLSFDLALIDRGVWTRLLPVDSAV
eukprot:6249805-Amphidinium_carterae.1